jgi:RNA polymerase sigma-70 factor, ECF subfamily
MNIDDNILIKNALAGDRDSFRKLLHVHYGMIYRVAYRFTGHREDAEDVAQEVCIAMVDKLASYKGNSNFITWLYRVVVNQCHDFQKKRTAGRNRDAQYEDLQIMCGADVREAKQKTVWLYRSVAALQSPYKETALLVLAEELSHLEAGKVLNCKESTISWRMHEVRKQLTLAMEEYYV